MNDNFLINQNVVPLLNPADIVAVATATPFVNVSKAADRIRFFAYFGSITAASADQAITVTMEAATAAASGSEVQINFKYRKSGAVGANTWGAITASASAAAGASIATTDDGKILMVEIDLKDLDSALADASHLRMVITPDAGGTATLVCAWAEFVPVYGQLTQQSAT